MRLILIILAIYFVVRFLGRLFMPFMNKSNSSGSSQARSDSRQEGEVTIEYTDKNKKNSKGASGEGDYVDFEELD